MTSLNIIIPSWWSKFNFDEDMQDQLRSLQEYRRRHPCRGWSRRIRLRRQHVLGQRCRCEGKEPRALCYVIALLELQVEALFKEEYETPSSAEEGPPRSESETLKGCHCYPIKDYDLVEMLVFFDPSVSRSWVREQYSQIKERHVQLCSHAAEAVLARISRR